MAPPGPQPAGSLHDYLFTLCTWKPAGMLQGKPPGPQLLGAARHVFEAHESQPNGCRTQHVPASLRAQLPNVGKLQLALCYPDHLPTNSTIIFQAPRATKSHLQPCDHLPLTCGSTSFVNPSLGDSAMSYIHPACPENPGPLLHCPQRNVSGS